MSEMGDMKFTTAGDMMKDDIVERLRIGIHISADENDMRYEAADKIEALRAALRDMAKYVWRGDWDKLEPETRALLGEKE